MQQKPSVLLESMNRVMQWITEGKLAVQVGGHRTRPHPVLNAAELPARMLQVSHRYPLERANEAFQAILQRRVLGKAIVVMSHGSRL